MTNQNIANLGKHQDLNLHQLKFHVDDHIPLEFEEILQEESIRKSEEFYKLMNRRRSVRFFSDKDVPFEVIENVVRTAGTSPSGAHMQPWTFVVVRNKEMKRRIRQAAEEEEKITYSSRMSDEWREDLKKLGTDWEKPFLETAPYLIVVFKQSYGIRPNGEKKKHYYVNESVGIAMGILITAIHNAGLVTLTHTPSPLNFLRKILKRPENEKALVLLPVGYPAKDATVPNLRRKSLDEIMVYFD